MEENLSLKEYLILLQQDKRPTRQQVQTIRNNIAQQNDVSSELSSNQQQSNTSHKKELKEKKILKKKNNNQCRLCKKVTVDQLFCDECKIKYDQNEYCPICKQGWKKNTNDKSIQCDDCKMWIHKKCDEIFRHDPNKFKQYRQNQELIYRCSNCRRQLKIDILSELIRYLTYFDCEKLLWQLDPNSVKYFEVIKNPIDFDTIHKFNKSGKYVQNSDLLYQDIKLLLCNFLEFNLPNPKIYRKGCILKLIYDILFTHFKKYLKMQDNELLNATNDFYLNICEFLLLSFKTFLNQAFSGGDLIKIEGISNFLPQWEPQLLSISPTIELRISKSNLIQWEKTINPGLEFENENEPLVKLNMIDFLKQQVQQDIKIKIDINLLTHRHPYLDYLLKLDSPYLTDDSNNSPQLQYSIKEMLTKDLSTIQVSQPITIKVLQPQLMVEYLCCSCGGYEHLNNLLMCQLCNKTYHFYCQINNSQYHQQRVLSSLQNWICNNCVKCKICKEFGTKNDLFCCNCNSFYHFQCVFHNFIAPTDGLDFWKCPDCFQCINCQSTQLFDTNKLSKIKPSTTSHTLHISIEYFQNFQYCLQCGLDVAGYRFCEYCEEYIPIDIEEMNKIQIEIDYSTYGSLYKVYFQEIQQINQQRIYLTKELKLNKSSKQCIKCKQFYHIQCLNRNKKTINEEGICSDCSQDMSTLLFKIEKLKEQNIRQSIQAKSLKKVVPVVSNFLEWGPQLTLTQQTFILENLEQLEPLVSNFLTYQHNIDNLKGELTNNKDINDEYIDKLTQYWCARFDWMEQPKQCFTQKQQIRQDFICNSLENDYYDRLLLIEFFKQKKYYSIYSLQTFIGIRNNIFQSQFALDTLCLITDLQCCYVENQKYDYYFTYLDFSYYMNFLSILGFYEKFPYLHMQLVDQKRQQVIFLPIPNSIVRSIKKSLGLQILALKQQSAKESILVQKGWAKIQSNSLKHNLKHLSDKYSDTQITEKLKSYQYNQKQIRQCIKDIKLLKDNKYSEAEQKLVQQEVVQEQQQQNEIQVPVYEVYEEQIIKYPQNQSDNLIESPLDNFVCQLCKKQGNRTVSGRLLYVDETRWVHTNCVIWNEDCRENELCVKALLKNNNFKCEYCSNNGSSIICCKCRKKSHFYCAYLQQWSFTQSKKVYCQICYDYQEHCVTNFMNWRKIVVQQKQDKKSQQAVYRFGNTILIAIKPSEQKGQFEELNLLTLRDKMLYISLNMKEFTIKYAEVNKAVFLQECEKCEKNIQIFLQVAKLLMDKYCQCVKEYKVYNLEQLLQSFKDFNIYGMEFNENLGQFFMLYTPQIRQQLLDSKNMQKIINSVQFTSFKQWFYQGIIVEDLPLDERIHQIQQLSRVISDTQIDNTLIYNNHPMIYDNLPILETKQSNNFSRKDPQQKIIHISPNDILEEAGLYIEDSKQTDKQDELEKKLRHDSKNQKQRNKLYVAPSFIHKYGLFTKQEFKKCDFVIEYTGEIIRNALADFREVTYNEQGFGDCYMFRASKTNVIDATFKGSEARFLNHSCQPNCASLLLDEKILIYAKKDILIGEELTYDYQFEIEAESQKIQCRCGAKNCVGRLN